uniref:Uncharacterized protein n=1 Tax=Arundo donax TaxID=35708 RepID=A0A0A8Y6U3_ARUDO
MRPRTITLASRATSTIYLTSKPPCGRELVCTKE